MIAEGDIYSIQEAVENVLKNSAPMDVLNDLISGLRLAGELYQKEEIYIVDIMVAAEAFKEAMQILEPKLGEKKRSFIGKVVIGTVQGDVHDIGKNLVAIMLESSGFEVIDIGTDVTPEQFVKAVSEHNPQILGMSAMLTTTMLEMENIIKALEEAGKRNDLIIMVGGAPISNRYAESIGADIYSSELISAIDKAKKLIQKRNSS